MFGNTAGREEIAGVRESLVVSEGVVLGAF